MRLVMAMILCLSAMAADAQNFTNGPAKAGAAAPATNGVSLAPSWNSALAKGTLKRDDVTAIIAAKGRPEIDLEPHESLVLYKELTYLMPIQKVIGVMNVKMGSKTSVTCPGFPDSSFFYYSFSGAFEEDCNRMLALVDKKDQLVGVQFTDEAPQRIRLKRHGSTFSLFNFVQTRAKGKPTYQIQHKATSSKDVLVVESELIDDERKPREYSRLYLPQPIVNLVAKRCSTN